MKLIIGLFALLLLIIGGIFVSQRYVKNGSFNLGKNTTLKLKDQTFKIIVAKTDKERQLGLSEKTSLPQDTGMIFVFDKPDYYIFWMKNMKFSLDIIYINNNKIVAVFPNQVNPVSKDENPPLIKPDQPADKVLELNGGIVDKYGMKPGDEVKIENL